MRGRRIVNALRENRVIASIALPIATVVQRLGRFLDVQARSKFKLNGGSVTFDGIELVFPSGVGIAAASDIYWNGGRALEPHTWTVLRQLIDRSAHFLDVGSNIGTYAVLAHKVNPSIRVDAFEPVPSIHRKNVKFHQANGISPENVHGYALGDTDSTASLYLPISESSVDEETTGTIRRDSWQATRAEYICVHVPVRRLDSVIEKIGAISPMVVKIDVEDFEAGVLSGAEQVVAKHRPLIVCEILPREHGNIATVDWLQRNHYVPFAISADGAFRFMPCDFKHPRRLPDFLLVPMEMLDSDCNFIPLDKIWSSAIRDGRSITTRSGDDELHSPQLPK